jgi:hypothetical protein
MLQNSLYSLSIKIFARAHLIITTFNISLQQKSLSLEAKVWCAESVNLKSKELK